MQHVVCIYLVLLALQILSTFFVKEAVAVEGFSFKYDCDAMFHFVENCSFGQEIEPAQRQLVL